MAATTAEYPAISYLSFFHFFPDPFFLSETGELKKKDDILSRLSGLSTIDPVNCDSPVVFSACGADPVEEAVDCGSWHRNK